MNEIRKVYFLLFKKIISIFFYMSAQEGGGKIRNSDHRFNMRGPSRLNYLLGTNNIHLRLRERTPCTLSVINLNVVNTLFST
jgi:hypothetical protein